MNFAAWETSLNRCPGSRPESRGDRPSLKFRSQGAIPSFYQKFFRKKAKSNFRVAALRMPFPGGFRGVRHQFRGRVPQIIPRGQAGW